jgi:hypothetical protein
LSGEDEDEGDEEERRGGTREVDADARNHSAGGASRRRGFLESGGDEVGVSQVVALCEGGTNQDVVGRGGAGATAHELDCGGVGDGLGRQPGRVSAGGRHAASVKKKQINNKARRRRRRSRKTRERCVAYLGTPTQTLL